MSYSYDRLIGKNIKKIREGSSFTQNQLVAQLQIHGCDITRSALAKIESGQRHIYTWELKALKTVLNVLYDDLFV